MKINNTITKLFALILLVVSFNVMAATDLSSLKATKKAPSANSDKLLRSATYYRTDVHVLNNSSQLITVKVPGTSINDNLYPKEIEDVVSDIYFDAVEVVLYDEDGYEFFRDFIPNHATVEVRNLNLLRGSSGDKVKTKVQAVIKK